VVKALVGGPRLGVQRGDRAQSGDSVQTGWFSYALIASDHYRPDLAVMDGSVALARRLFDSGFRRDELDAAMIYDAFSPIMLMQLEALGFCGPGEAKGFVADGNLGLDGALPTNTNGGLIGEGYIHGLNLVLEAARQLRGTAVNQVAQARRVLVTASRNGAILTRD